MATQSCRSLGMTHDFGKWRVSTRRDYVEDGQRVKVRVCQRCGVREYVRVS